MGQCIRGRHADGARRTRPRGRANTLLISVSPISDAGNANKAADAVVQANTQVADVSKDADFKSFRPSLISVEVLGFGDEDECSSGDPVADAACRKRKLQKGGS